MSDEPAAFHMIAADFTYLRTRYESRIELMAGERMDDPAYAFFWRFTMNLLEENRLKLEAQPIFERQMEESSFTLFAGVSYQATADLALRSMYQYTSTPGEDTGVRPASSSTYQDNDAAEDNRIVFQVYYYRGM
jgi:opacity protein-like surface antigen